MIYYKKTLLDGSVILHVHPSRVAPMLTNSIYPKGIDTNVLNGFEVISYQEFSEIEAKQYSKTFFDDVTKLIKKGAKPELAYDDVLKKINDKPINDKYTLIEFIKLDNPIDLFYEVKEEPKNYNDLNRFELLKMVREFSDKNPDQFQPDRVWNTYKTSDLIPIAEKYKL